MRAGLTLDRAGAFDTARRSPRASTRARRPRWSASSPLFLLVALVAIARADAGERLAVHLPGPAARLLPPQPAATASGASLSWHGAIELGKALLKTLLIGGVAAWVVWAERAEIVSLLVRSRSSPALAPPGAACSAAPSWPSPARSR